MNYLKPNFQVALSGEKYRNEWERIFSEKHNHFWECGRCKMPRVMAADTEDWPEPLCGFCYEEHEANK